MTIENRARVADADEDLHPHSKIVAQPCQKVTGDCEHIVSFHVYVNGRHVGEPIWATAEAVHAFAKQLVVVAHEVDAHNIADDVARRALEVAREVADPIKRRPGESLQDWDERVQTEASFTMRQLDLEGHDA